MAADRDARPIGESNGADRTIEGSDAGPDAKSGYPGSKGAAGVAERIIRQMPPHQNYVELFAGHAAIYWRKRRARRTWLNDLSWNVCQRLCQWIADHDYNATVMHCDALDLLAARWAPLWQADSLVYCDPPYLRSVRTRSMYECELETKEEHATLLAALVELPAMVMISGYDSPLYRDLLQTRHKWRVVRIPTMTRGGLREECVWCNFPEPLILHDPAFAGKDYRDRERLHRKQTRWKKKFAAMDQRERQVIATALAMVDAAALEAAMTAVPVKQEGEDVTHE